MESANGHFENTLTKINFVKYIFLKLEATFYKFCRIQVSFYVFNRRHFYI